ncbi:MAG TPA: hypothetical protein VMY39_04335, partial [Planctomycetota bacterium]|nr:hypothetical protein [Planctomycetota bacterium]
MQRTLRAVAVVMCLAVLCVDAGPGAAFGAPPAAKDTGPVEVTVLRTAPDLTHWAPNATLWRYRETWRTDLARTAAGKLVHVDPFEPRVDFSASKIWKEQNAGRNAKEVSYALRETTTVTGSTFPPADWTQPEFDDASWIRLATPMQSAYRGVALVCMRGKFEVTDPAGVSDLSL